MHSLIVQVLITPTSMAFKMHGIFGRLESNLEATAAYNNCVFPGDIDGSDICAATNGLNREEFDASTTQATVTWDASDRLTVKYIYGFNELQYHRTTDDDNTPVYTTIVSFT